MPDTSPPGEAYRVKMLLELQTLLGVLDRRLPRLRDSGPANVLAKTEELRTKTVDLIAQLVKKP